MLKLVKNVHIVITIISVQYFKRILKTQVSHVMEQKVVLKKYYKLRKNELINLGVDIYEMFTKLKLSRR